MDKNSKQTKAVKAKAKAKAEEAALNRILYWIAGGSVLEFLLLLLNRYYYYYRIDEFDIFTALSVAVKILAVAGLVCAGAALFWWNGARKAGKDATLPAALGLLMLGVSASGFAAWFFYGTGIQFMYIAVPVIVVLALIFYLYQHEFFVLACQGALTMLGIWVCARANGGRDAILGYAYLAAAAAVLVVSALVSRKAQTGNGKVEVGGKEIRVYPKDANYPLLYAGAVLLLVVLVLAGVGINQMALYAVTVAWLLIMAVYYTVKLM